MNDRLKNYLALTAGFVAISPLTDAQIIYTDVNPDLVLTGNESFNLDINNDGIFDYLIKQRSFYYSGGLHQGNDFWGLNNNEVLSQHFGNFGSYWYFATKPLNFWDDLIPVGYEIKWKSGGILSRNINSPWWRKGLWKGFQDKYVGLHFKIDSNFHYGWVRLDVAEDCKTVTIKDYAYNSKPDQLLKAGSSKVSLPDENPMKNIRVYSTAGIIRIEAPVNENLTGRIRLSDINGRVQRSIDIKNEKNVELNTQELPGGLYIVNILTEKGTLTKKVLIR